MINPLIVYGKPLNRYFYKTREDPQNSEDPDEMPHFIRVYTFSYGVKKIFRQKDTIFLENYNLTFLDMYNGLSQVFVSNQKEESISIQRV